MIVYAESSAVLSWMLGEPEGLAVERVLRAAEFVVASDLTLVECDRVFHRARSLEEISIRKLGELRRELRSHSAGWVMLRIGDQIVERARNAFPVEPLRSLDALHLASALDAAATNPEIALLTLDDRVRQCGQALGLRIVPRAD